MKMRVSVWWISDVDDGNLYLGDYKVNDDRLWDKDQVVIEINGMVMIKDNNCREMIKSDVDDENKHHDDDKDES